MNRFGFPGKWNSAQRLMGIAAGRPIVGPQTVSLEITHHCNLRCVFCESHGSLQALPITARREYVGGRRTMDLATIERLVRSLTRIGGDLVELSGKGDPIAHPELAAVVRTIKQGGLRCALVTNATLAKPDLAPTLVESRLDRLNVSLNAGSREVYLKVNGRDLWDKAVAFLEEVLARRKAAGSELPWVRVSHVINRDNAGDLPAMIDHACALGIDEINFYVMAELPETGDLQLREAEIGTVLQGIPGWSRKLESHGIAHDLGNLAKELPLRARTGEATAQDNPLQRKLPCYEAWMFCVIGPDGTVVPCCFCEEEKLGNIFDEDFDKIWWNARYRDLRRRMIEMPATGRWICGECFTTCSKAVLNQRIYNKIHPLQKVRVEAVAARAGGE
ncbi:MAG: radical SAM protein [Candidatus Eisenbacteria bacterium]|nr:radical SAM protein [Candidatus Eisenbacteria bacterium]